MDISRMTKMYNKDVNEKQYDQAIDRLIQSVGSAEEDDVIDMLVADGLNSKGTALDDMHQRIYDLDSSLDCDPYQSGYGRARFQFMNSYDEAIVNIYRRYWDREYFYLEYVGDHIDLRPINAEDCKIALEHIINEF